MDFASSEGVANPGGNPMSITRELTHDGHTHTFIVTQGLDGWNLREEEDEMVLCRVHCADWRCVESDTLRFEKTATALKRAGWTEH
jgi:hypothetical protein